MPLITIPYDDSRYPLIPRGDYDEDAAYEINDLVTFTDSIMYRAISIAYPGESPSFMPGKWVVFSAGGSSESISSFLLAGC
jgi:hypothetical protein